MLEAHNASCNTHEKLFAFHPHVCISIVMCRGNSKINKTQERESARIRIYITLFYLSLSLTFSHSFTFFSQARINYFGHAVFWVASNDRCAVFRDYLELPMQVDLQAWRRCWWQWRKVSLICIMKWHQKTKIPLSFHVCLVPDKRTINLYH